jgi:hypothetical protein
LSVPDITPVAGSIVRLAGVSIDHDQSLNGLTLRCVEKVCSKRSPRNATKEVVERGITPIQFTGKSTEQSAVTGSDRHRSPAPLLLTY